MSAQIIVSEKSNIFNQTKPIAIRKANFCWYNKLHTVLPNYWARDPYFYDSKSLFGFQ